jgi:hypothetical protein
MTDPALVDAQVWRDVYRFGRDRKLLNFGCGTGANHAHFASQCFSRRSGRHGPCFDAAYGWQGLYDNDRHGWRASGTELEWPGCIVAVGDSAARRRDIGSLRIGLYRTKTHD